MNPFDQQSPIPGIKLIIVVGSGKGGVGKSTVAVNLAKALSQKNLSVGLLDADIYGPSIPRMMGALQQKPPLSDKNKIIPIQRSGLRLMSFGFLTPEDSALVWRGPMLFKAIDQFFRDVEWGELDYLVIDLPPGTGDVALTIAQKVPVSGAIVVCTPQNIALIDAKKAIDMFERINVPLLGIIENMAYLRDGDNRINLFPRGELDAYLDARGWKKLAQIPFHPHVGLSCESGIPLAESYPDSPEAMAFNEVANYISKTITT